MAVSNAVRVEPIEFQRAEAEQDNPPLFLGSPAQVQDYISAVARIAVGETFCPQENTACVSVRGKIPA
jgi:hypothetical protein